MSTLTSQALFSDLPPKPRRLPAAVLLVALLLHLALLLWKAPEQSARPTGSIEVRLEVDPATPGQARQAQAAPESLETPEPSMEATPEPAAPAAGAPAESAAGAELVGSEAPERPPEDEKVEAEAAPPVTTINRHALLDAVSGMDWSKPADSSGIQRPAGEAFDNRFYRPVLPVAANAFDGTVLPSETETVDQWQEPGGEHRVVIKGVDGEHYCGRQMPLDDMRPWTQMPMLFHRCGGGGKRSGISDWRNN